MEPRKCMLPAITLSAAMFFGTAATAADLPKEGTWTATYSGYGSYKATTVGKGRWFLPWDENGLSVGTGLLDHMTWHCWGVEDGMNTIAQAHGYCVLTDPAGDQIVAGVATDGKVDVSKPFGVTATLITGTGKFVGISGGWTAVYHGADYFKTAPEATYALIAAVQGSYKLP